jgi:hypothetical protein
LNARCRSLAITFTEALDRKTSSDPSRYAAKVWSLRRTAKYGSDHHDEHRVRIAGATLSSDGRTVLLEIPDLRPTWCMEVTYAIKSDKGKAVEGVIHNTIHHLSN